MANYRKIARQKARKYGLDPVLFERQIGAESNFDPNAGSPAGAKGIAQIMDATARGWGVDSSDPVASLDAAAKNMASYVRKYGGWKNALVAYNAGPGRVGKPLYAETAAYIQKILQGKNPRELRAGSVSAGNAAAERLSPASVEPMLDRNAALAAAFISGGKNPLIAGMQNLASGEFTTQAPAIAELPKPGREGGSRSRDVVPRGNGTVKVAPGADRAGVKTGREVLGFVERVAGQYGKPLTVTTGTQHSRTTTSGSVSEHWDGNAVDIAATGRALTRMGQAALIAAGMDPKKARRTSGGLFNLTVTIQGRKYRAQVIYNTTTGGNHFNHLHVGYRPA